MYSNITFKYRKSTFIVGESIPFLLFECATCTISAIVVEIYQIKLIISYSIFQCSIRAMLLVIHRNHWNKYHGMECGQFLYFAMMASKAMPKTWIYLLHIWTVCCSRVKVCPLPLACFLFATKLWTIKRTEIVSEMTLSSESLQSAAAITTIK